MLKTIRKVASTALILIFGAFTLSACGEEVGAAMHEVDDMVLEALPFLDDTLYEAVRENPVVMRQLLPVEDGEELVVLHTNFGDIKLRMFPEDAPIAVENFVTHARNGYYDGVIFHRVIEDFMIQGGDPDGTGMGGESIWGEPFGLEPSFNLRHFRGALAMAHGGGAMNSQFYIVQNGELDPVSRMQFEQLLENQDEPIGRFEDGTIIRNSDIHPAKSAQKFIDYGGTPHLDWFWNHNAHTVFGHVVEGMDVVDEIAATPVGAGARPLEEVIINSISFVIYGE